MANAYPVMNATEGVIRDISGTKNWLMGLEGKADVRWDSSTINPGDYTVMVVDAATANTADKTSTSVVADKGVRHAVNCTTANYYQPVKMYDSEMQTAVRNGMLQSYTNKDIAKQVDAVMKALSAILVDALSDGVLTRTATLADGNTNFAAADLANQALNFAKFTDVQGEVMAYNDGLIPDWCLGQTVAYGNIIGYSNQNMTGIRRVDGGGTAYEINGIPFWPQANGTPAKWGDASVPCILMGANRHIIFALRAASGGEAYEFETATGTWVLPINITTTYGVDFTGTTGLALGIGEVINGVS